jgi:hypothetical protein
MFSPVERKPGQGGSKRASRKVHRFAAGAAAMRCSKEAIMVADVRRMTALRRQQPL